MEGVSSLQKSPTMSAKERKRNKENNRVSNIPQFSGSRQFTKPAFYSPVARQYNKVSVDIDAIELSDAGSCLLSAIFCKLTVGNGRLLTSFASTLVTRNGRGNMATYTFADESNKLKDISLSEHPVHYALLSVYAQGFDGELIGEASISLNFKTSEPLCKQHFLILRNRKKIGEAKCTLCRPTEGFLDDSASEDEDQASATPSPFVMSSALQRRAGISPKAALDFFDEASSADANSSPQSAVSVVSESPNQPQQTLLTTENLIMHRQTTTQYCAVRAGNMDHITAAILTPVGKTESMQIVDVPEAVEMVSPADTISELQMSPLQTPSAPSVLEVEKAEDMADTDFRQVMEAEAKESLQELSRDYREETVIEVVERDETVSESCPLESDGAVGLTQHPGEPLTIAPDRTREQFVEAVALPVEPTASTSVVATASAVMTAIGSPRRANSGRTSIPALRSIYRQQQHLAPLRASTPTTNHVHQRPSRSHAPVETNTDNTILTTTPNPVPTTRTATSTSVQKRSSLAEVKARLSNIAAASSPTVSASLPVSSTSTSLLSPTATIENKKGSPLYQERLQKLRSVNPVAVMGSPKRSLRRRPSASRISEKELSSMTVTSDSANEMPNIKSTETSIDVSETNPSVLPTTAQTLCDQLASPMVMLTLPMRILLSVVELQAVLLCYFAVLGGNFGSTPMSTTTTAKVNEIVNPPSTQQYPHYKVLSMMTNPVSTLDGLNIPIQLLIEPAEQQLRRSSRSHRTSSFDSSVSGSTYHQCLRWVSSSVQPELDLTVLNSTTTSNSGVKEYSSKEVVGGSILRGVAQWFFSQQFRVRKLLSRLFQRRAVLPTIEAPPPKMEVASSNTTSRSNRTVFGSLRPSDCSAIAYSSEDYIVDDRTHNWWRLLPISADTPLSLVSLHDAKSSEVDPVPFLLQHVGEGLCLSTQIVTSTIHAPATDLSENVQTAVLDAIMGSSLPRQQQPLTRARTGSLASVPLSTLQSFESSNHNRADNTDYSNEDASGMSLLLHPSTETVLTTCDPSHPSTVWTLQQNRLMAHQLDRMVDTKTDSEQTQKTTYHTVWAWEASYRGLAVSLQQEQQHQVDATVDTLHQDFMPTTRFDGELEVSIGLNTWGRKVSHDSESGSHREIYGLQRQQFDSVIH